MKWYKRDPHRWLEGTREIPFEAKGLYADLIEIYVARDRRLPNDDQFLAAATGSDIRVIRRLKKILFDLGKLRDLSGTLVPNGVEVTMNEAESFSEVQSIKAKKRWENKQPPNAKTAKPPQPQPQEREITPTGLSLSLVPVDRGNGTASARAPLEAPHAPPAVPPELPKTVPPDVPLGEPCPEPPGWRTHPDNPVSKYLADRERQKLNPANLDDEQHLADLAAQQLLRQPIKRGPFT